MSQFIIIHCKTGNEPVAINADYILTIYTGETGTTITTRQKQIVWCTETMDEILQMIGAVTVIRCKDCKHKYIKDNVWTCPFGLPAGCDFYCGYGERETE